MIQNDWIRRHVNCTPTPTALFDAMSVLEWTHGQFDQRI